MKTHRAVTALAVALITVIGAGASIGAAKPAQHHHDRQCFPASHWGPMPDRLRPCVEVLHVEEDGSFAFRVSDADGTTRYVSGVGVLDR
jgi:hypothetical protein